MRKFVLALAIFAGFAAPMVSSANAGSCWVNYVGGHAFVNCN